MDKETIKIISEMLDCKLGYLDTKMRAIDSKLDNNAMLIENLTTVIGKNALELETLNNKLEIIGEVQQNMMLQTQKQIEKIIEPFSEDLSVIKSAIKHTSIELEEISDKIEFISMKEFNNERDLFMMKKRNSQ
jgi:hypothetical protein